MLSKLARSRLQETAGELLDLLAAVEQSPTDQMVVHSVHDLCSLLLKNTGLQLTGAVVSGRVLLEWCLCSIVYVHASGCLEPAWVHDTTAV